MGHDVAHTGIVLAACVMHTVFPVVRIITHSLQLTKPPGMTTVTYQRGSGVLSLVALIFDCFVAKYTWEWRQIFEHAGEVVLVKNCLALFIIAIISLANEGILLGICNFIVVTTSISTV